MYTQRSADSNRLWRVHSALLRFWPRKKEREKKGKNFFLITIQCSRGEHWKYIPHTSCVSAVSSCNRSYPIERYKSRARVDESCGSRRYARDHTRVDDSCFLLSRLLSPSPRPNNGRAYTRILNYTRGLDTVSLHERPPPISAARSSIPRKRRAFHSQLICVYLQTSRSHERKGKINFCIVEEPCRRN